MPPPNVVPTSNRHWVHWRWILKLCLTLKCLTAIGGLLTYWGSGTYSTGSGRLEWTYTSTKTNTNSIEIKLPVCNTVHSSRRLGASSRTFASSFVATFAWNGDFPYQISSCFRLDLLSQTTWNCFQFQLLHLTWIWRLEVVCCWYTKRWIWKHWFQTQVEIQLELGTQLVFCSVSCWSSLWSSGLHSTPSGGGMRNTQLEIECR